MTLLDRDALRRSYDRSAATYDDRFRALQRDKYAVMLGNGTDLGRRPWLDLGCGTGLLKAYLEDHGDVGNGVFGLDFSHAMLVHARQRGLAVARGDVDVLPFADATFDAVLAFTVLGILPDPAGEERTLAEVARVLVRHGLFVLTVLQANHDPALVDRLRAAGLRLDAARPCGQDVGYRCTRV